MVIINLILFLISLAVLIKCAGYSIKYSSRIAKTLKLPEFAVSFFIIAFISILPEATISIISAINGEPELGLGTLLGSNVTDLTLVFGIVALFSLNGIKVKSKILRNNFFYLILLLLPLILGIDGRFSRIDGGILVFLGILFYTKIYMDSIRFRKKFNNTKKGPLIKTSILLFLSLAGLLISAIFTVRYSVNFAKDINLPSIIIGLTILAIGTCLPELTVSIRAVKNNRDGIALGDILGTVVTDATIILGLVALISPFSYSPANIFITGTAMFIAGIFVTIFMKSENTINKVEGLLLIIFYIIFIIVSFFLNNLLRIN